MASIRVRHGCSLDGTLTSHIERVADEFDMPRQSAFSRTKYPYI